MRDGQRESTGEVAVGGCVAEATDVAEAVALR